ncbi:MAG: glycosyltransferase family 2 protein [Acidobacteriaceae bacterium]|jgi:glycosyltransferase involved in cell wall biosynthesis|nr:glycosyltransferase family 2 protein [Acidobacteriaceae bacterium]
MKTISIVTPCYNEQDNAVELCSRIRKAMAEFPQYRYEHVLIDNCSTDHTVAVLKELASQDTNIRIIVNARDFGPMRSHMHAMFQASGDAVIMMASDLQDPPEMIGDFIREWECGFPMVLAIKTASQENKLMFLIRKAYYALINNLASIRTFENFTGFGLYDRRVVEIVKAFGDPYPYFRGMIAEIGLPHAEITFTQPRRLGGISKFSSFYKLYDVGMIAITNLSKIPLRAVTFFGFVSSVLSLLVGLLYLVYKLVYWYSFSVGVAPLVIGLFFFSSVQMLALGIIGEYLGSVHTYVQRRPLVVERERVNFEFPPLTATQPPVSSSAGDST